MKIMYLLFSFTVGGTERLVANICNEMQKRNNEIHLYIVNDLVDDALIYSLDKQVKVCLQKRKIGSGNLASTSIRIAEYVRNNDIEVIHCNSFDSPELVLISKIIKPRVKVYYTVHGMNQYKNLSTIRKVYRNIVCERIIGISECVKRDLLINGSSKKKTVLVYNGIVIKEDKSAYTLRERTKITIGCVARFMPSIKGQDVLVKAARFLRDKIDEDFKVVFAGGVADNQKDEYNKIIQYVEDNKLSDVISFIGVVDDVPKFMQSIDICVVPSRSEGFGLTLIEAMSMGVPCISSDIDGLSELIRLIGIGDLFETGNSEALADVIVDNIKNLDEKKKRASMIKDKIKDTFSIKKMCDSLEKVYEV